MLESEQQRGSGQLPTLEDVEADNGGMLAISNNHGNQGAASGRQMLVEEAGWPALVVGCGGGGDGGGGGVRVWLGCGGVVWQGCVVGLCGGGGGGGPL